MRPFWRFGLYGGAIGSGISYLAWLFMQFSPGGDSSLFFVLPWWYVAYPLRKLVEIFGVHMVTIDVMIVSNYIAGVMALNALLLGLLVAVGRVTLYARRERA